MTKGTGTSPPKAESLPAGEIVDARAHANPRVTVDLVSVRCPRCRDVHTLGLAAGSMGTAWCPRSARQYTVAHPGRSTSTSEEAEELANG